jgi:hypothetical protein
MSITTVPSPAACWFAEGMSSQWSGRGHGRGEGPWNERGGWSGGQPWDPAVYGRRVRRAADGVPDDKWWLVTAIATPLSVALAIADLSASGYDWPLAFRAGYLIPVLLTASSALPARTVERRRLRMVLAGTGCAAAFYYTEIVMTVLATAWLGTVLTRMVTG